jgi:MarR-like DNA-binding transcriptional regulator SgrR of sgrS sRNA
MKNFRSIDLPRPLIDEIEQWVKNKEISHNTVTSFVEHAVRILRDKTKEQILDERRHKTYLEKFKP